MVIKTSKQSLLELLEGWHSIETDWPDVKDSVQVAVDEQKASVPQRFVPRERVASAAGCEPRVDVQTFRSDIDTGIDQRVDD